MIGVRLWRWTIPLLILLITISTASAQITIQEAKLIKVEWYQNGVKVDKISVGHPAVAKVYLQFYGWKGIDNDVTVHVRLDVVNWFDKELASKTITVTKDGIIVVEVPFTVDPNDANQRGVFVKVDGHLGGQYVRIYDEGNPNKRFSEGTEIGLTTSPPPSPQPYPTPQPTPPSPQPTQPYGQLLSCKWYQNGREVREIEVGKTAEVVMNVYTRGINTVKVEVRLDIPYWFDKLIKSQSFFVHDGYHTLKIPFVVYDKGRGVFVKVVGYTSDGRVVKIYDEGNPNTRFSEGTEIGLTTSPPSPQPTPQPTPYPPPYPTPTPYPPQPIHIPEYPTTNFFMYMFTAMMFTMFAVMFVVIVVVTLRRK